MHSQSAIFLLFSIVSIQQRIVSQQKLTAASSVKELLLLLLLLLIITQQRPTHQHPSAAAAASASNVSPIVNIIPPLATPFDTLVTKYKQQQQQRKAFKHNLSPSFSHSFITEQLPFYTQDSLVHCTIIFSGVSTGYGWTDDDKYTDHLTPINQTRKTFKINCKSLSETLQLLRNDS